MKYSREAGAPLRLEAAELDALVTRATERLTERRAREAAEAATRPARPAEDFERPARRVAERIVQP